MFPKLYKTVILTAWREKYPESSVTLKGSETEMLRAGALQVRTMPVQGQAGVHYATAGLMF